jgi:hypothetical protein
MNERGINSFEEFLLFYVFAGFIVVLLWAVLEADIVLGPVRETAERRARRLRISRVLAPLGVVHVGFALVAADAARSDPDDAADEPATRRRRRAAAEASAFLAVGIVVLLVASSAHLPLLQDVPGARILGEVIPWE